MQKIAILYDASQAVLSTFDLDEVSQHILRIMRDYFQLEHSAIFLLDQKTGEFEARISNSSSSTPFPKIRTGEGLIGSAAKLKRPVYSNDVSKDPRYICAFPSTKSELAIPLMLRDEVAGVLDCQSDRLGFFDDETTDLLMLFSTQASIAIQNAHLYALEQRRAKQLEAINTTARQTTEVVTDIRKLLDKVALQIVESFRADGVSILLFEGSNLVPRAYHGNLTPSFPLGEPLVNVNAAWRNAVSTNTPFLLQDVTTREGYVPAFAETRSELVLPLVSFGHTIGALTLDSASVGGLNPEDIKPLESVADIGAAAIQNAYYFERVKQLAYRDGLTGVYNRRFFESRMVEEIERAQRHGNSLAVLMVDIDNFKKLNDEFGHLLGDEVLKQVSRMFLSQTRKSDLVCRYGGDELAVLLPEETAANAMIVAEKLRRAVAQAEFPGVPRRVTLSIGAAEFPANGTNRDELIKSADDALYTAKQSGRNRCVLCTEQLPVSD